MMTSKADLDRLETDVKQLRKDSILIGINLVGEFFKDMPDDTYTKEQVLALIRLIRTGAKARY
jgi:hypothetical protein